MAVPAPPPSDYAQEGTRAHELAEKILNHWIAHGRGGILPSFLGDLQDEHKDTVDSSGLSMVDHVMRYVDVCRQEVAKFDSTSPFSVKPEVRVTLDAEMRMFGTVDLLATGTMGGIPTGVIVDLKYGRGLRVEAEGNPQLAYYAVALKNTSKKQLERIKVTVVQPRIEEWYTECWYTLKDLEHWRFVLTRGAEKALFQIATKRYEFSAGEHCRFCPAKGACGVHARMVSEKAALDFSDDSDSLIRAEHFPPVLTPEKVSRILSAREDVRRFIEAVEHHAVAVLSAGGTIPGFKIVESRTHRKWVSTDHEAIAEELRRRGVEEPYEGNRRLRSPSAIEKELTFGAIADLTRRPQGTPTVVPESDPRAEYREGRDPGSEFGDEAE